MAWKLPASSTTCKYPSPRSSFIFLALMEGCNMLSVCMIFMQYKFNNKSYFIYVLPFDMQWSRMGRVVDHIHQFRYATLLYLSLYRFSFHKSKLFLLQLFRKVSHTLKYTLLEAKLVYKSHSREPENVAFMNSRTFYTSKHYMHYSVMGKMRLPFIDNDLLDRGAL